MNTAFIKYFKNRDRWLPVFFILPAVMLRFWMLGDAPFRSDTMEFYKMALHGQNIFELWKNPPWSGQIPLNETLSLLLVHAGLPPTPFVVRLPFAAMGVLALFFVWRFARRWFGYGAALLTLLIAVFNPYQLYFSRTAYHYSGAICWSAALFLAFWANKEILQQSRNPSKKQWILWFLVAALACHMHMSVWVVVGLQGLLFVIFGWKLGGTERSRFFVSFSIGTILLGGVMLRWVIRAVRDVLISRGGNGTGYIGATAGSEFLRLLPAYFAGENIPAIILLVVFIILSIFAFLRTSADVRRFRSLVWISVLHIAVLMLYISLIGGGIAKITYFSAVWPHFILLTGIGAYLGVQKLASGLWRTGLYLLLAGGYIALTAWPDWAVVHLEGTPTPYYKINDWVLKNLPAGTPILTDRWLEPWNELAVHNPGNINYTFTVPDDPLENYRRFNWRAVTEQFFEKYPEAALLEVARGRYENELEPWTFQENYFARIVSITNNPAMIMRRMKINPSDFCDAYTNRVVTRIFYNTTEDLISAARRGGRDVLRLYGEGWGYAKPGWPQGDFRDYRTFGQTASIDLYDLKEVPLNGSVEISAATAERPKTVSLSGTTTVFAPGRIRTWTVPVTLQPGRNPLPFTSPSADPLFVLDIRWKSGQP